jgi:beta-glucosidase
LPISFPADERQLPRPRIDGLGEADETSITVSYREGSNIGYRWFAARADRPLFPFGFGLSYTQFEYSGLHVESTDAGSVKARLVAKNTGRKPGACVPQLYLVSITGRVVKRLVGFSRLSLAPGESREASLQIDPRLLAHWDEAHRRWQIAAGRYAFALGDSSEALGETTEVSLQARRLAP